MELDSQETTLYRVRDNYGEIRVAERGLIRFLYFGHNTQQSATFCGHPQALILRYAQAMSLALLFNPLPKRALILGLGGGSLANFLLAYFPETNIDVIELRPEVIEVAHTYFSVPRDHPRLSITVGNAHHTLYEQTPGTWDLILSDAFDADGPAEGMGSSEHARRVRRALTPNGVACFNLWNRPQDDFPSALKTIADVFKGRAIHYTLGAENSNALVLGFPTQPIKLDDPTLDERAAKFHSQTGINYPELLLDMRQLNSTSMTD